MLVMLPWIHQTKPTVGMQTIIDRGLLWFRNRYCKTFWSQLSSLLPDDLGRHEFSVLLSQGKFKSMPNCILQCAAEEAMLEMQEIPKSLTHNTQLAKLISPI